MKKYNWAIVGTGWAASDMADALNKENGVAKFTQWSTRIRNMLINLRKSIR